jgi:rhamnogalacturonan endolyase
MISSTLLLIKENGQMSKVLYDNLDLTGSGKGPYVDCTCTPDGSWVPGSSTAVKLQLFNDIDSTRTAYGGVVMTDTYAKTNQSMEEYWFLRDGESGLHVFTRVFYFNESQPFLVTLGELRTLFRPNTPMWTHLYVNGNNWAKKPSAAALAAGVAVQDATTYVGNSTNEGFVQQYSDFFTKYSFSDQWRDHKVHGMWSDGSTTSNNVTYGAWLVHNAVDTYYGGPLHSDIMVDDIVVCSPLISL